MQANSVNRPLYSTSDSVLDITNLDMMTNATTPEGSAKRDSVYGEVSHVTAEPTYFRGQFASHMDMQADAETVARYLDDHPTWFRRCAHPMKAEPLGNTGYALTIGKFGSFGYEIEPKIGLDLLPQDAGIYRIRTIAIPGYVALGYDVDFQASLELVEKEHSSSDVADSVSYVRYTSVEWQLDLKVSLHFPRFIHALPQALIQTTGDRLLQQIVRQVSKRLTHKVQEDFHRAMGIPFTTKRRRSR